MGIIYLNIKYMTKGGGENNSTILFREKQVRRHFDEDKELWYFSIIDVIDILTEQSSYQGGGLEIIGKY